MLNIKLKKLLITFIFIKNLDKLTATPIRASSYVTTNIFVYSLR